MSLKKKILQQQVKKHLKQVAKGAATPQRTDVPLETKLGYIGDEKHGLVGVIIQFNIPITKFVMTLDDARNLVNGMQQILDLDLTQEQGAE